MGTTSCCGLGGGPPGPPPPLPLPPGGPPPLPSGGLSPLFPLGLLGFSSSESFPPSSPPSGLLCSFHGGWCGLGGMGADDTLAIKNPIIFVVRVL